MRKKRQQVKHETYYTERDFKKKTKRMTKKGWSILNIDIKKERPASILLPLAGPLALLSTNVYYVTYQK